jgi:hypothetical protein
MTGIDQPDPVAATTEAPSGIADAVADRSRVEAAQEAKGEDERTVLRIERLPRDVGWMMVYVGMLGVVLPGIIGTPFLVAGIAVLAPGGPKLLTRWIGRKPRGFVHASLKQMDRWLDDLERRYPRLPTAST